MKDSHSRLVTVDLKNEFYFRKLSIFIFIFVIFFIMLSPELSMGENKEHTINECLLLDRPMGNEFKDYLLNKAKREALNRIYGEAIGSTTEVKNLELISDLITAKSIGIIRTKGDSEYYNSTNTGEVCVKIVAYITEEDLHKLQLKKEVLVNHCFSASGAMTIQDVKENTMNSARQKIISTYNHSLGEIQLTNAKKLVRNLTVSKEKFNDNLNTYCIDAEAFIVPFVIESYEERRVNTNLNEPSKQMGPTLLKGDCEKIRAERDLRHCEFKDASLAKKNLYSVDLTGVNMSGAYLVGAHPVKASLYNANLQGANLERVNLSYANLQGANLQGANLEGANLSYANLQGANLQGARLAGARFYKSTLVDVIFGDANFGAIIENRGQVYTDFTEADLSNTDLYDVNNVSVAIYSKATVKGTTFDGVKLDELKRETLRKSGANVIY